MRASAVSVPPSIEGYVEKTLENEGTKRYRDEGLFFEIVDEVRDVRQFSGDALALQICAVCFERLRVDWLIYLGGIHELLDELALGFSKTILMLLLVLPEK